MFTFQTKKSMLKGILFKKSPFYIQFYISNKCHLRCKMCNIVEANSDIESFGFDKIEPIIDNLKKIGAGVILLTGGEPFLRNDIDEIVKAIKSRGLDVRMQTAGLFAKKEKIAQCVVNGARDINVSFDSLDEELSDYINGIHGSWSNALKTISFISKTFPSKDSICALGCVLSKYNIDEIDAVLDFATEIGWWLSLVPVHLSSNNRPLNFRGYDEYFAFSKEDYPKVLALINKLKKKKREGYLLFDSNDYLDSIYEFISTGKPSWRNKDICDTPNLYFAILPDGSFAPCCDFRFDKKMYIYNKDFPKIYKSKEFQKKVKEIACKCPGCNFGSFPEMTLSARSFSTIKERIIMQFKAQSAGVKPLEEEDIYRIILNIKEKYSYYKSERTYNLRSEKFKIDRNS